jgi:hypothetical protein
MILMCARIQERQKTREVAAGRAAEAHAAQQRLGSAFP